MPLGRGGGVGDVQSAVSRSRNHDHSGNVQRIVRRIQRVFGGVVIRRHVRVRIDIGPHQRHRDGYSAALGDCIAFAERHALPDSLPHATRALRALASRQQQCAVERCDGAPLEL